MNQRKMPAETASGRMAYLERITIRLAADRDGLKAATIVHKEVTSDARPVLPALDRIPIAVGPRLLTLCAD